jgi:hypothetical protein
MSRMSRERIALLRYLGADVVLTPGTLIRDVSMLPDTGERYLPDTDKPRRVVHRRAGWLIVGLVATVVVFTALGPGILIRPPR